MVDEGDQQLPIANVGRIMKNILPPTAKISKGAKERMQECVTEFISFVTGEASDKCHKENRKTVNGDDICWALSSLGFDNYAEAMTRYLHRYRELEREKAASQGKCTEASYPPCSSTDIHHKDQIAANNITQGSERPAIMPLEFRIIDHNKGKTSSFT